MHPYRHPHQMVHDRQQLRHIRHDMIDAFQSVGEGRGGGGLIIGEERA